MSLRLTKATASKQNSPFILELHLRTAWTLVLLLLVLLTSPIHSFIPHNRASVIIHQQRILSSISKKNSDKLLLLKAGKKKNTNIPPNRKNDDDDDEEEDGEVGKGPNWIERAFPVDFTGQEGTGSKEELKKIEDYNLGISGVSFQMGGLSKRKLKLFILKYKLRQ